MKPFLSSLTHLFEDFIQHKASKAPWVGPSIKRVFHPANHTVRHSRYIIDASLVVIVFILVFPSLLQDEGLMGNRAKRDIYAKHQIEVEDVAETTLRQQDVSSGVPAVYVNIPDRPKIIEESVYEFLEDIQSFSHQNASRIPSLFTQASNLQKQQLRRDIQKLDPAIVSSATQDTLAQLLRKGIKTKPFFDNRAKLIQDAMPEYVKQDPRLVFVVTHILAEKIHPTLKVNESLTKEAIETAIKNVPPVTRIYTKGDIIIAKGDVPTKLQRDALNKLGLLTPDTLFLHVLGVCLLSLSLISTIWFYIWTFERKNYFKPTYISLLNTLMVITFGGLAACPPQWLDKVFLYPLAIFSLMLTIFTNPRVAIFITMMIVVTSGLALQIPLEHLAVLTLSSMAGILYLIRHPVPKNRLDILNAGVCVGVVQALSLLIVSLIYNPHIQVMTVLQDGLLAFFSGIITGIITLGALPLFENWFKIITPFTLMELANQDLPVLKRMQLEAPGTFHHSLIISTLAEAACEAIGADGLLAKVGSMYHDIGKLRRPLFFIENQAYFGAENPHDKLSIRLSKMIVMSHPRDGMEMGRKIGLPEQIIAFMPEHHGTLLAGYFYNKAVLEEGEEKVIKDEFRYPGPKPQTKETAIVMMADACESAVRSLKNPTQEQLEERIDKIIKQRIDDYQFNEAPITMRDIQLIRDTFVRILRAMQHNRIEYQIQPQIVNKDYAVEQKTESKIIA